MNDAVAQAQAAVDAGDIEEAIRVARAGTDAGVEEPSLLHLLAFDLQRQARYPEALRVLARARVLAPDDALLVFAIGDCMSQYGRPLEAKQAFEAVLETNPHFAPARHGLGLALETLGDDAGARIEQERAMLADPNFPDPRGALAALAFKRKHFDAARAHAEAALALDPRQSAAALTLANVDAAEGRMGAVVERLRALLAVGGLTRLHEAAAQRLLADALDALDQPDAAFAAYLRANAATREVYSQPSGEAEVETGVELAERLRGYFEAAKPEDWAPAPVAGDEPSPAAGHVFLVGFPRSGTTLLEQVLASHPDIVALEEKATLPGVLNDFANAESLDALARMSVDQARERRRDYWERVRGFGVDPAGKVFVDKLPLATLWLPLIAKLFPDARVLFARRDPRDVVLSCFRRRFVPNNFVYEFTDLERAARFYSGVMRLAETYRAKLPPPIHTVRYEALVEDFDGEVQAVCAFLEIDWDPLMRDFSATARRREVRTPSAPQVRRALYSEGVGQWRRYAEGLAPIAAVLEPWVERYGYPTL